MLPNLSSKLGLLKICVFQILNELILIINYLTYKFTCAKGRAILATEGGTQPP